LECSSSHASYLSNDTCGDAGVGEGLGHCGGVRGRDLKHQPQLLRKQGSEGAPLVGSGGRQVRLQPAVACRAASARSSVAVPSFELVALSVAVATPSVMTSSGPHTKRQETRRTQGAATLFKRSSTLTTVPEGGTGTRGRFLRCCAAHRLAGLAIRGARRGGGVLSRHSSSSKHRGAQSHGSFMLGSSLSTPPPPPAAHAVPSAYHPTTGHKACTEQHHQNQRPANPPCRPHHACTCVA
jgi:hypothetical protein